MLLRKSSFIFNSSFIVDAASWCFCIGNKAAAASNDNKKLGL